MQVDGYSLDAQRDKLRKYAAYEDMVVAGEYSDEGFSGKNIQGRQEFQRMLNDIQDCKDGVSYVLVFKLSRFGRNAADVLNSLQLMQDFGVNLICVEDGIDSSKDAGKLMISVLSAVAEIERENIRTQTMAGREQKAREGKWNGGFAPYGYKLENGNLVIAEDEVEVIRVIYDRYIHTNEGVAGVAKYLNRNGYTKKLRQNNTIPGFSRDFVKNVLYNPVYMGKIAYGRRRTEKKQGTRNEMHVVEQSEFPVYEGQHEAIISEEDKLTIQLRLLKIINDTASLNNSSVVSNVYTPTIPHLNTYAASRHSGIPIHHVPIISIIIMVFVLPPLLIMPPPRIIFSTLTGAYRANTMSSVFPSSFTLSSTRYNPVYAPAKRMSKADTATPPNKPAYIIFFDSA